MVLWCFFVVGFCWKMEFLGLEFCYCFWVFFVWVIGERLFYLWLCLNFLCFWCFVVESVVFWVVMYWLCVWFWCDIVLLGDFVNGMILSVCVVVWVVFFLVCELWFNWEIFFWEWIFEFMWVVFFIFMFRFLWKVFYVIELWGWGDIEV